jgi:hypothetical protein
MNKECIYDVCHRGPCKKPTVAESDFCEEHLGKICNIWVKYVKKILEPRL